MKALNRSLYCLSRPPTVVAIGLLLLNDHLLKAAFPGWWTGKLSDVAGLFFFPFVVGALLAWLLDRLKAPSRLTGAAAFWLVGGWFAAMKTVPLVNGATILAWQQLVGGPVAIVMDPTDLLALPVLWPAWRLWKRSDQKTSGQHRSLSWSEAILLGAASAASLATSCIEPPAIYDVFVDAGIFYAVMGTEVDLTVFQYREEDNQWQPVDREAPPVEKWPPRPSQSCLPGGPCYRVSSDNQVLFQQKGSQTWNIAWAIPAGRLEVMRRYHHEICIFMNFNPYDIIVSGSTNYHRVIVAHGSEGVLMRHPDGTWERQAVGLAEPTPFTITSPSIMRGILAFELALASAGALLISFVLYGAIWRSVRMVVAGVIAGILAFGHFVWTDVNGAAPAFEISAAIILGAVWFILAYRWLQNDTKLTDTQQRTALSWWLLASLALPIGFPFMLLWLLGPIAHYQTAVALWLVVSLVLAVTGIVKSWRLMRRNSPLSE